MGRPKGHGPFGDKASSCCVLLPLTDVDTLQQPPSIHLPDRAFQREKAAAKGFETPFLSANAHCADTVGCVLLPNGYRYPRTYSRSP